MIRDTALSNLIFLANKQGYVLTDDILDEGADLSFTDVDWLSSTLMAKGIPCKSLRTDLGRRLLLCGGI